MSDFDDQGNGNDPGAPLPKIGEYRVVVLDESGKVSESFSLWTQTTFPAIGTAIDLIDEKDGTRTPYRVRDVRHSEQESESFSQWRFTGYVAVVQKDSQPLPSADPPEKSDDESGAKGPPVASATTTVLDFRATPPGAASPLFSFLKMIGWAVWEGYREQTQRLESLKFLAWQLQWDGRSWLLYHVTGGHDAAYLRELSRSAKREAERALAFLERLRAIPAAADDQLAEVISLDIYRSREAK